jgi:hypothetical protein
VWLTNLDDAQLAFEEEIYGLLILFADLESALHLKSDYLINDTIIKNQDLELPDAPDTV